MEETLLDMISKLEKRAAMYVGNEVTVGRISAFLSGWLVGIGNRALTEHDELNRFATFLAKKYDIPPGYGWDRITVLVSEKGDLDVESLFKLFNDFKTERVGAS